MYSAAVRRITYYDQASLRADFTRVVFGRECVERDYAPKGFEREVLEARQLQEQLETSLSSPDTARQAGSTGCDPLLNQAEKWTSSRPPRER